MDELTASAWSMKHSVTGCSGDW